MNTTKSFSRLITLAVIIPLVLSCLAPSYPQASGKQTTVTEGTGKGPNFEVIRTDEEGNEIQGDVSYEEDIRGSANSETEESEEKDKKSKDASSEDSATQDEGSESSETSEPALTTITISTEDDLVKLARNCRLDTWSRDKYVVLANDIRLRKGTFRYIPIFSGTFDGDGHTISNFDILADESYTGFFCITQEGALIKDLNVIGHRVLSENQLATGGIVGDNYGTIRNCTFQGHVEGFDYTGGIAGYNEQSGVIGSCETIGSVTGKHFTGGIAGYNQGSISGCINNASVNITNVDESVELKNFDISKYANNIKSIFGGNTKEGSSSVIESTIDTGGICGYSQGIITGCTNNESVGYDHVGYNVGGIAGRQCGYISMCTNYGEVLGRKDVGGIVGQAEPYIMMDITEDIIDKLTTNMNSLHDLVNITLNDAGDESDIISKRLDMVRAFTDKALNDTSYLANETENWVNGVVDGGNDIFDRLHYAVSEATKSGGAIDLTKDAMTNASTSFQQLRNAVRDLDLYKYMTEQERIDYDKAVESIEKATEDYENLHKKYKDSDYDYEYYKFINLAHNLPEYSGDNSVLKPVDSSGNIIEWPNATLSDNKAAYANIAGVVRVDTSTDPPTTEGFPSSGPYADADSRLNRNAMLAANTVVDYKADNEFRNTYGKSYPEFLEENLNVMTSIISAHLDEMTDEIRRDLSKSLNTAKQSISNLKDALNEANSIGSNLSSKGKVTIPKLSPEYQSRTNSLVASIQGMSDNLGQLNNEINNSSQVLVDDMVKVNDQFNTIMLLIADAIDGVLNRDTEDLYTDNSLAVAEECTDGTVADSTNYGEVWGDINTSGIAGTMAIEYDFDLESDITGVKDAAMGKIYRTKCVMRNNTNEGEAVGLKSYVGGICGYQEMGTILRCQNYGKMSSTSGDYVGGISGQSLSTIRKCHAKGILKGRSYIGGVAGMGYDIGGCTTLPTIKGEEDYMGAIAGDNDPKGNLTENIFVCEDFAGVDRVSFSGKAEPISYEELMAIPGLPSEFDTIRVSYILDGELLEVQKCNYGDDIVSIPLSISTDEYIDWDWENTNLLHLKSDSELTGVRARYITTLASQQLRGNGQSAILVDGKFTDLDHFMTYLKVGKGTDKAMEDWSLSIPVDGQEEHLLRYCPPDGVKEVRLWLVKDGKRNKITPTKMGKYLTFNVKGEKVNIVVENADRNILLKVKKYIPYIIAAGAVLLLLLVIRIVLKRRKKKNRKSDDELTP